MSFVATALAAPHENQITMRAMSGRLVRGVPAVVGVVDGRVVGDQVGGDRARRALDRVGLDGQVALPARSDRAETGQHRDRVAGVVDAVPHDLLPAVADGEAGGGLWGGRGRPATRGGGGVAGPEARARGA